MYLLQITSLVGAILRTCFNLNKFVVVLTFIWLFDLLTDETTTWDMVTSKDLWDDKQLDFENKMGHDNDGGDHDDDDFVLVKQEDIVEGIACFMATYLLSLKETKVM